MTEINDLHSPLPSATLPSSAPFPALRQSLEAVQFEHEGQPMVLIRDQEGLTDQGLALSIGGFLIATLLNGRNTAEAIQSVFTKSTGTVLNPSEIHVLVSQLDKADLLETPAVQEKRKKVLEDFRSSSVRPAQHMGSGYPKNSLDLALHLGKYFQDAKGPKKEIGAPVPGAGRALGLISPHIDLNRGGPAYAWAYQALSESPAPDAIVALGVAHASPPSPWVGTKKEFETPYGPLPVHAGLYQELKKTLWYDPAVDEAVHRTEHSLEFQALWLKYLWKDKTPPWLPVLCSSFYAFSPERAPSHISTIESALLAWGQTLRARLQAGESILILMGVDLAHVGRRFGDDLDITPELRAKLEAEDRASLARVLELKADEAYQHFVMEKNRRRICGLSALYTGLRLLKIMTEGGGIQSRLLTYDQADDPMGGVVTFASALFHS